ncbi:response regulator transcription factor [Azospirillum doebereinerae]|uniref:Response regulator transcription factor n=1 Tax=Azospirillum doebereinerae TaxID=92933 RepID=A0A3S1CFY2_9PROT|nr:response regulator transcription factor [Azospirillum doebereinerae]MCG5239489.1 response regulator transcription factor [Azospirillum doebereinerae]RUQ68474.1 response regulator transcription factor [Azospirillum doebereinerae]
MRILVVEDTEDLADAIVHRLRKLGYAVDWVASGDEAEELLVQAQYQLVLLDIMLPGLDGQAVLTRLRRRRNATPVLMMTARSQVDVKIDLLDLGADDFIVKPFDLRELEARCRALLRRSHGMVSSRVEFGNLVFDAAAKKVLVDGRPVDLGGREFRLLELFLANLGAVMAKEELMDRLFSLDQPTALNAIELYVSRLRRKMQGSSLELRTVRGLGYVADIRSAD